MDIMGDADELYDDDSYRPPATQGFTPEARVLTGAGLLLASLLGTGLFQAASFFVFGGNNDRSPSEQYALYAGPSGVLALAGAVLAGSLWRRPVGRMLHGAAVAVTVVGLVLAAAVALGFLVIDRDGGSAF
jgi:hypothetical protein